MGVLVCPSEDGKAQSPNAWCTSRALFNQGGPGELGKIDGFPGELGGSSVPKKMCMIKASC